MVANVGQIGLPHGERPRFLAADRKSDRDSVNETKSALFLMQGNDRIVGGATAERIAIVALNPQVARSADHEIDPNCARNCLNECCASPRARTRLQWTAIS
ncbi:hypothetical protein [Bradyrhizobium sp. Rc3b]|uniref:hypothetical protein n=1 Tax=Bradyrhizobium sp. Rc3b TaxID=1855322 RepID=UPI001160B7F0|nr:hypothetical protein [Bradyrhizobium sp. Rc3b]